MRVITGIARGRRLITLEGNDVRPTTDKVKEAIFSSIQFDIEGRRILDLFAGSGQLGIEALSRGADSATFIDLNTEAVSIIRKNLESTGLSDNAKVLRADFFSFCASTRDTFDVAFLDPPYREDLLTRALSVVQNVMSDYGIIICEHPTDIDLPQTVGEFNCYKKSKYGKIAVSFYRKS